MKKNTLAKLLLASAAMVVAFACQSKNSPKDGETRDDSSSSSCGCTSACSEKAAPVEEKVAAVNEDSMTYVIEIGDAEEVATTTENVPAAIETPAAPASTEETAVNIAPASSNEPVAYTTTKTTTDADADDEDETPPVKTTTTTTTPTPAPTTTTETTTVTPSDDE